MNKNLYFRNTALTAVLGAGLAVCVIIRALSPMCVLPKLDIPTMVLLSLAALLLDHYLISGEKQFCILCLPGACLSFGLLPWLTGFADGLQALKLGVVGGIVFAVTAWLFLSVQDRLTSGPAAKAAPVLSALGLYLAAQCFSGIFL